MKSSAPRRTKFALGLLPLAVFLAGPHIRAAEHPKEPEMVTVQHILISFKGRGTSKPVTRKKSEAEALAQSLMERIAKGEDFDALVKEYTDDTYPGIYKLTNDGVPITSGTFAREQMVMSFGDVAFSLAVGEVGMAKYDGFKSRYGWHIIKRLE